MSRVALALALLAACTPSRKIERLGSIYVLEVDVSAADGATLEVTDEQSVELAGTRLVIPPGALATDTRVTITIGTDIPEDGSTPAGPTVEIGPLGTQLNPAAELTVPLTTVPQTALARVYARDATASHPTKMPDVLAIAADPDADSGRVTFSIHTFLAFQPAVAANPCSGRTCPSAHVCRNGGCFPACDTPVPLRHILFLVDQTDSMSTSDPTNARLDAIIDVVDAFVTDPDNSTLEEGVSFAIVGFYGDAIVHTESHPNTPGFSSDGVAVKAAVAELTTTGPNSGYDRALAATADVLSASMANLSPTDRARATYQVVFVSDGPPFPDSCDGESNSPGSAVRRVEILVEEAAYHDVWLEVSTAQIADPAMFVLDHDPAEVCCMKLHRPPFDLVSDCQNDTISTGEVTRGVLQAMAHAGDGAFLSFSDTSPVDFGAIDFEPAVSTPCPDGFSCQLSHNLCVPRLADGESTCSTDQDCAFRSVCVAGTCVADEFGCGNACQPSSTDPYKIIFALDASTALTAADPAGAARRAIVDAMQATSAAYPHAHFRIVGFNSETLATPGTSGCPAFSRNRPALILFMNELSQNGVSDTHGVLNVVREDLRRDMEGVLGNAGCGVTQADDELASTHYAVVLITTGLPTPTCTLGLGNDFDPLVPTEPYRLCENTDFVSCVLKRDGTVCDAGQFGTCGDGAPGCAYDGNASASCCDTDFGWDGLGDAPHDQLFGGLAGGSELHGGDAYNQPFQLDARVRAIIALREELAVASIRLHTVRVPNSNVSFADENQAAGELMKRLAQTGRGFALSFPDGVGVSFAALDLDAEAPVTPPDCAERVPQTTCGTPPPYCPEGTYPEHSELIATECGLIATWTGECRPC